MDVIKEIENSHKKDAPVFSIGDTVKVHVKIKEGKRERVQIFEGIVIAKSGSNLNESFKVRRVSFGIGVERTFLLHSPFIQKVEISRAGKVRRAKLFFLRKRVGKAAQVKERRM